jgi:hypothetical protein
LALFPLIGVAHTQQRQEEVEHYMECLLDPTQQILPEPLNKMIYLIVQSTRTGGKGEARDSLEQILTLGKSMGYL